MVQAQSHTHNAGDIVVKTVSSVVQSVPTLVKGWKKLVKRSIMFLNAAKMYEDSSVS